MNESTNANVAPVVEPLENDDGQLQSTLCTPPLSEAGDNITYVLPNGSEVEVANLIEFFNADNGNENVDAIPDLDIQLSDHLADDFTNDIPLGTEMNDHNLDQLLNNYIQANTHLATLPIEPNETIVADDALNFYNHPQLAISEQADNAPNNSLNEMVPDLEVASTVEIESVVVNDVFLFQTPITHRTFQQESEDVYRAHNTNNLNRIAQSSVPQTERSRTCEQFYRPPEHNTSAAGPSCSRYSRPIARIDPERELKRPNILKRRSSSKAPESRQKKDKKPKKE